MKADDHIQQALTHLGPRLEEAAATLDRPLRERDMLEALRACLRVDDPSGDYPSRRIAIAGWDPQPGAVDVVGDGLLAELKWCYVPKMGEAIWDLFKLASATIKHGPPAYLVTGAPDGEWKRDPGRRAVRARRMERDAQRPHRHAPVVVALAA